MYAVVILKHSLNNIVVPISWIDGIAMHQFANHGVIRSKEFVIFHSNDLNKNADFSLKPKDYYETLGTDSCFYGYFKKIYGTKHEAEKYCEGARGVRQTDYSSNKKRAANEKWVKPVTATDDSSSEEDISENKQAIQDEIGEKIKEMNNRFFDLTEDEVDAIQETLEYDGESEDINDVSDSYAVDSDTVDVINTEPNRDETMEQEELMSNDNSDLTASFTKGQSVDNVTPEKQTGVNQDDSNRSDGEFSEENVRNDTDSVDNVTLGQQTGVNQDDSNRSDGEFSEENVRNETESVNNVTPEQQASVNQDDSHRNNANDRVIQVAALNVNQILGEANDDDLNDEHGASFEWIIRDTDHLHQPQTSKIDPETFEQSYVNGEHFTSTSCVTDSDQNACDANNEESNETTDQESQLNNNSDHTANVTNSLISIKEEVTEETDTSSENHSGNIPIFSPPSTSSNFAGQVPAHFARLDPNLYRALSGPENNQSKGNQVQASPIQDFLNIVPCIFPDNFTHKNTVLRFNDYNVEIKLGIIRLLVEWQNSATFSSILYDYRFLHLLLSAVFTEREIMANDLNKNKMKFIKGVFTKRVGTDVPRLMRFVDYIQRYKENVAKKSQKQNSA